MLWQRYFTLKGAIFQAVGEAMWSIRADLEEKLKDIPEKKLSIFGPEKMKKVTSVFLDWDKKISDEALHNSKLFFEIKTKLKTCEDEERESLVLLNLAQILKDHDKEFYNKFIKTDIVEQSIFDQFEKTGLLRNVTLKNERLRAKQAEQKKAFEAALDEIQRKQTQKENEMKELADKVDTLTKTCHKKIRKYKTEIRELKSSRKDASQRCSGTLDEGETQTEANIYNPLPGNNYKVRATYKRINKDQISLKKGDTVKMIMPPDYKGLALVEKRGWFRRKKSGLFPVRHLGSK